MYLCAYAAHCHLSRGCVQSAPLTRNDFQFYIFLDHSTSANPTYQKRGGGENGFSKVVPRHPLPLVISVQVEEGSRKGETLKEVEKVKALGEVQQKIPIIFSTLVRFRRGRLVQEVTMLVSEA